MLRFSYEMRARKMLAAWEKERPNQESASVQKFGSRKRERRRKIDQKRMVAYHTGETGRRPKNVMLGETRVPSGDNDRESLAKKCVSQIHAI